MSVEYLFIIYSCKNNLERAESIYQRIHNNNGWKGCKVLILYGEYREKDPQYRIIDDKYMVINARDDYDHLYEKTTLLFNVAVKAFPSIKGLFKCDDDIVLHMQHIQLFLQLLTSNNDENQFTYCGKRIVRTKEFNEWSRKNGVDKYPTYECIYCGGPLYYLNRKALDCFVGERGASLLNVYYEDMMVGIHLNKWNIYPDKRMNLYTDNITESGKMSYHNKNHHNDVMVWIQGGLGNQLFQVALGMSIAQKQKKKFVLNITKIITNPHQNRDILRTIQTLQGIFPSMEIVNKEVSPNEYIEYTEKEKECFTYLLDMDKEIGKCAHIYNNIVYKGYFIHHKYIPYDAFKGAVHNITPTDKTLLEYDFTNHFFVHIRLGDYLKIPMYQIDLLEYYRSSIRRIHDTHKDATFYICTNQYDGVLYDWIGRITEGLVIKYKIQQETDTDIDTLYSMSKCSGGICSNSTLSFMGAVFQVLRRPVKEEIDDLYIPYPFVKFTGPSTHFKEENLPLDMYPEWFRVFDTMKGDYIE